MRCGSFESLESSGEVVGGNEVGEMLVEVFVGLVVEAFDGGLFEDSVHAFGLSVGPGASATSCGCLSATHTGPLPCRSGGL